MDTGELFGICHLLPGQPRTECAPYRHDACYPTNVSVECDACGAWMPLPDRIARRRDHIHKFCCADAGRTCGVVPPSRVPSMIARRRPEVSGEMATSQALK